MREAITSRQMADRFEGAGLGEEMDVFGGKFQIVGLFEAGHGAAESEVWTDLEVLAQTTKRVGVRSSLQMRANSPDDAQQLTDAIQSDEQFGLAAISEPEYFADQAKAGMAIKIVGGPSPSFLPSGPCSPWPTPCTPPWPRDARDRHAAGLGFGRMTVLLSFLMESLVLCLIGGASAAWARCRSTVCRPARPTGPRSAS